MIQTTVFLMLIKIQAVNSSHIFIFVYLYTNIQYIEKSRHSLINECSSMNGLMEALQCMFMWDAGRVTWERWSRSVVMYAMSYYVMHCGMHSIMRVVMPCDGWVMHGSYINGVICYVIGGWKLCRDWMDKWRTYEWINCWKVEWFINTWALRRCRMTRLHCPVNVFCGILYLPVFVFASFQDFSFYDE